MKEISRRTALQAGLYMALGISLPESISHLGTLYSRISRQEHPKRKEIITDNSFMLGISPDMNDIGSVLKLNREMFGIFGSVNFFATGLDPAQIDNVELNILRAKKAGLFPIVSWRCESLKDFTSKRYASTLIRLGRLLGKGGLRFQYEMNGFWFPQVPSKEYIRIWKNTYKLVKSKNPEVSFIFCPNATIGAKGFVNYFPGDEFVDICALDVYDRYVKTPIKPEHYAMPNLSPAQLMGPDLMVLKSLTDKPIILGELNSCREGQDRATWIAQAICDAASFGLQGALLFDWKKEGVGERDWRICKDTYLYTEILHLAHKSWINKPKQSRTKYIYV